MNTVGNEFLPLVLNDVTLQMFLLTPNVKRGINPNEVKTITKVNLDNDVISALFEIASTYVSSICEKQIIDLFKIDKPDDDYLVTVNLRDIPDLNTNLKVIEEERFARIHVHDLEPFLKKLRYFVITVQQNNTYFHFIKKQNKNNLVMPKRDFYVFRENVLSTLRNETIFTLPNTFDAVVINGLAYISDENSFTATFKFYEKQKQKAQEVLDTLNTLDIFENFEQFNENIMKSPLLFKRMSKVDPDSVKSIDFESISLLKKNGEVDLVVDVENKKIKFENKKQFEDALDVILQNYVQSRVSGAKFYALNKIKEKLR